ncbi:hypothetical protein A2U01_0103547, partial [Trifolium medium]|nr:hypothetical protein [Trifolium medium]
MEPVKELDYKYFHSRFKAGPINNHGDNGGQDGNEEEEDQGMCEVMEEIDHFDG